MEQGFMAVLKALGGFGPAEAAPDDLHKNSVSLLIKRSAVWARAPRTDHISRSPTPSAANLCERSRIGRPVAVLQGVGGRFGLFFLKKKYQALAPAPAAPRYHYQYSRKLYAISLFTSKFRYLNYI
eukprot:SAG31_NODE_812_length_11915_cov_64.697360_11_plen_126_part_00